MLPLGERIVLPQLHKLVVVSIPLKQLKRNQKTPSYCQRKGTELYPTKEGRAKRADVGFCKC